MKWGETIHDRLLEKSLIEKESRGILIYQTRTGIVLKGGNKFFKTL